MEIDAVQKLIRFLETHNGRDKAVRLLQYFCRFWGWYNIEMLGNKDIQQRMSSVESNSSLARKVFRMGKSISLFNNVVKAIKDENQELVPRASAIVANFCLGMWLLYDHLIWFGKVKMIQGLDLKALSYKACSLWIVALGINIFKNMYTLYVSRQKALAQPNQANALEKISGAQFETSLDLVRLCLDVTIPLYTLSETFASKVPTGYIGVTGGLSSLIGLYQVWNKTK